MRLNGQEDRKRHLTRIAAENVTFPGITLAETVGPVLQSGAEALEPLQSERARYGLKVIGFTAGKIADFGQKCRDANEEFARIAGEDGVIDREEFLIYRALTDQEAA